jgi:hypothetical protein
MAMSTHGSEDLGLGGAGIRVTGDRNIAAVYVANAFTVEVQGRTIGMPTAPAPNIGIISR